MSQLLETIKCHNGKLVNIKWHNLRFNQVRKEYFGLSEALNLEEIITIPEYAKNGLFRCRVLYSKAIEKIEFIPHHFRTVKSLKLVEANAIYYQFKYSNRNKLNELFERRGDCDDILIVKNNRITDSYTANAIFFDGHKWWTSDTPLLPGTQRAKLIDEGNLSVCKITPSDLSKYKKTGLINALWDLQDMPVISSGNIQV
jgi:4-amino-4-deoxychorismate lyase